MPDFVFTFTYI